MATFRCVGVAWSGAASSVCGGASCGASFAIVGGAGVFRVFVAQCMRERKRSSMVNAFTLLGRGDLVECSARWSTATGAAAAVRWRARAKACGCVRRCYGRAVQLLEPIEVRWLPCSQPKGALSFRGRVLLSGNTPCYRGVSVRFGEGYQGKAGTAGGPAVPQVSVSAHQPHHVPSLFHQVHLPWLWLLPRSPCATWSRGSHSLPAHPWQSPVFANSGQATSRPLPNISRVLCSAGAWTAACSTWCWPAFWHTWKVWIRVSLRLPLGPG